MGDNLIYINVDSDTQNYRLTDSIDYRAQALRVVRSSISVMNLSSSQTYKAITASTTGVVSTTSSITITCTSHNLSTGDKIFLDSTDAVPDLDSDFTSDNPVYYIIEKVNSGSFKLYLGSDEFDPVTVTGAMTTGYANKTEYTPPRYDTYLLRSSLFQHNIIASDDRYIGMLPFFFDRNTNITIADQIYNLNTGQLNVSKNFTAEIFAPNGSLISEITPYEKIKIELWCELVY